MFKEQYIDVGTVRVGEKKVIQFPYNNDQVNYISILQGCGCASVSLNKGNSSVDMEYIPDSIPQHLQSQGYYNPTKSYDIAFSFNDGTQMRYTLAFKCKVVR